MATLRQAVLSALTGDSTLMTILTGGVGDWDTLGRTGLTPGNAVYETDDVRLKPQAVVSYSTEIPALEPYGTRQGRRRFMQLWVYSNSSYATIDSALRRAEVVLHRLQVTTDDAHTALLIYVNDGPDFIADELEGALARYSRYYLQFSRH